MKILLRLRTALSALFLLPILWNPEKADAQDSLSSVQQFLKGVSASGISVTTRYQSATISWPGVSFPLSAKQGGYLLVYATSAPGQISSPDGSAPANTVLNGIVVPTTASELPNQPITSAQSTGLTDGTTYYFMIVAYIWDGVNTSSYQYSSAVTICATIPPDQPSNPVVSSAGTQSNYISGSFSAPSVAPDGYVVTFSEQAVASPLTNGTWYQAGQAIGSDTIVQESNATSFNTDSSGHHLSATSVYYIHLFSYVISGCNNMPVYSTAYVSYSTATSPTEVQDSSTVQDSFLEMIDIQPNPVETDAVLKISTMTPDNHVVLTIFTVDGRKIAQRITAVMMGVNRISLFTENLSRGMYILKAQFSNGKIKALPFIKK